MKVRWYPLLAPSSCYFHNLDADLKMHRITVCINKFFLRWAKNVRSCVLRERHSWDFREKWAVNNLCWDYFLFRTLTLNVLPVKTCVYSTIYFVRRLNDIVIIILKFVYNFSRYIFFNGFQFLDVCFLVQFQCN